MPRKWNDLGRTQIAILRMVEMGPKTKEHIAGRLGRKRYHHGTIPTLLERKLIYEVDGLFYPTDHGKAVLLPPEEYRQWRLIWGME